VEKEVFQFMADKKREGRKESGQDMPFKDTPPVTSFLPPGLAFQSFHHLPIVYSKLESINGLNY
jgi:hypothetical protein